MIGSTVKGVIAGLIIGLVAQRTQSLAVGIVVGLAVGAGLAALITIGGPYFWEIVLPGAIVGVDRGLCDVQICGAAAAGAAERVMMQVTSCKLRVQSSWSTSSCSSQLGVARKSPVLNL